MIRNKVKISSTQMFILELMNKGWALGHSKGLNPRAWLQKNGVGRGGESKKVSMATFYVLYKMKAIELEKEGYPTDSYRIAESWKSIIS